MIRELAYKFLAGLADRLQPQASGDAYRLGRVDERTKSYQPPDYSGDAAIMDSTDMMNPRVRDLVRNTAQFKKAVESLADLVIGHGIQGFSNPIEPGLELTNLDALSGDFDFAMESDARFEEWANDPKQFDVAGKRSWWDFQRLAFMENVTVGDVLMLRCQVRRRNVPTPLCYQLIERDQLDDRRDRPRTADQNKIINGIELDSLDREVGFWVYEAHPDDYQNSGGLSTESVFIPASRMMHLYLFKRPSQSLGTTWLSALGQTSFDRDKFLGTELQAAAKAALLAMIVKRQNPGQAGTMGLTDGLSQSDRHGNQQIKLGSTPLAAEIGVDEEVSVVESNRPNANAQSFFDLVDHDAAAAAEQSYYRLTGRYQNTSYTAVRGAHLDDDAHVKPLQRWFGAGLVLDVRRQFNAQAAAAGLLKTVTVRQFAADLAKYQRFDLIGSGREALDPEAETEAAISKLRGGLSTLKIECARRGLHWIRVLRQIAIENAVSGVLGVTLDYSKGQGGQVTQSTRESQSGSSAAARESSRSRT